MMETLLIYFGKAALATAAFCLTYFILFRNRKQFSFNRIYLLSSLAISYIIPLITFTTTKVIEVSPVQVIAESNFSIPAQVLLPGNDIKWDWQNILTLLYGAGFLGFLLFLLSGHARAIYIIRSSIVRVLFGTSVHVSGKDIHPFSFFRKIVIPEEILPHPDLGIIIDHEKIHVEEKHTIDILISEVLFLMQWFNPFAWLLKDAVKNNLEYKTDDQVIKKWAPQAYQLAMVSLAGKQGIAPFLTAMDGSQLKNRIIMMKKKTENKFAIVKQLIILPLLALLVMGLANREVKTRIIQNDSIVIKGKVTNEAGIELPGTIVMVKNTSKRTIADQKGNYEIKIESIGESLVFSIYGYEKQEIEVKGINLLNVVLKPNKKEKQGPDTVIGYPTRKKVGTVDIGSKEDGKSGVEFSNVKGVVNNNGDLTLQPQEDKKIKLEFHGDKSKQPLYIVDGIETDQISDINPDNIESITVLKDKSATILYGEKGKNGVIQVKTKNPTPTDKFKQPLYIVNGITVKNITDINPESIESVDVLKGKTATEEYGEKGKNGVIMITLKDKSVFNESKQKDFEEVRVFDVVEKMPEFPGGEAALKKFIAKTMKYPEEARDYRIQGTVYVTFIVENDGTVSWPRVAKSVDPALDREALRIANALPAWKPGIQNGIPVPVNYTIPVNFVFPENKSANTNNSLKSNKLTISEITHSGTTFDGSQYVRVEKEPEFPGGWQALLMFIKKSVQYPQAAIKNKIYGEVWISCIVDADGKIKNPAIARSVDPALDKEALRIVNTLPKWEPGKLHGKPVDVFYAVPVTFILPWESYMVPAKDSLKNQKKILYIVDGREYYGDIKNIPAEDITSVSVVKNQEYKKIYGDKANDGVIIVNTRTKYNSRVEDKNSPLILINGKATEKTINNIDPNTIASVNILKEEKAIQKYGDIGKNGVIEVTLKNDVAIPSKEKTSQEEPVFTVVEEMPEFPGGMEALKKYIADAINYPAIAMENGIQGKVYVSFVVNKEGSITKAKLTRGVDPALDNEALRVVNSLPAWKPGKQRGVAVNVNYTIPVEFKLPAGSTTFRLDSLSALELRKMIAKTIKYPVSAQEQNVTGKVRLWFDVDKDGKISRILDEKPAKSIRIDEVVVVGYGIKGKPSQEKSETSEKGLQLLKEEAKRTLNSISYINDRSLHGKTVEITVSFMLQ